MSLKIAQWQNEDLHGRRVMFRHLCSLENIGKLTNAALCPKAKLFTRLSEIEVRYKASDRLLLPQTNSQHQTVFFNHFQHQVNDRAQHGASSRAHRCKDSSTKGHQTLIRRLQRHCDRSKQWVGLHYNSLMSAMPTLLTLPFYSGSVGFEAALKFVQLGADRVILGVRTLSKGDVAKAAIEHKTGRKNVVDVWHVDMLDYESLKSFADRASKELEHLDIVVLNAGVLMASYQQSSYGWEKTLQVNSLSTTLLGLLLMPKLKASKTPDFTPKLELVSSTIFLSATKLKSDGGKDPHAGPLAVYNRHDEKQSSVEFSMSQYQASKLFLEYAHKGLADLAMSNKAGEPNVIVVSVCPGATKSDIARDHTSMFMRSALWLMSLMQRSSEQGSRTYISGVAFGKEAHGRFWVSDTFRE